MLIYTGNIDSLFSPHPQQFYIADVDNFEKEKQLATTTLQKNEKFQRVKFYLI